MAKIITRYKEVLEDLEQQPQSQGASEDQLLTLAMFANKLGLYDAADVIRMVIEKKER